MKFFGLDNERCSLDRDPSLESVVLVRGFEVCGVIDLGFLVCGVSRLGYGHCSSSTEKFSALWMICNINLVKLTFRICQGQL